MASDRLVTSQHVLKAVLELQRRGSQKMIPELEALEPDLVEYMIESLCQLHHKLMGAGLSGVQSRKLYRQAETIVLVSVTALRNAHRDLWQDSFVVPATKPSAP